MDIRELTARNQRRLIIKLLSAQKAYKASIYDLYRTLNDDLHAGISMDKLTTEIHWLIEQGFCNKLPGDILFIQLTAAGLDINNQNSEHPGIEVPLPGQA